VDAELVPNLPHIDALAAKRERGISRDHKEPAAPGQRRDNLFRYAVGKIVLLWIATHIDERQDGYRWLVWQRGE
jgi:hypothetical protein